MDIRQLKSEIAERKRNREAIRHNLKRHFQKHFGVPDFWELVGQCFQPTSDFQVCLCRQLPTGNIEHLALFLFAEWLAKQELPTQALFLSVPRDTFLASNPYKKSLAKVPYLSRTPSGNLSRETKNILEKKAWKNIDGKILYELYTDMGLSLSAFHQSLLKSALDSDSYASNGLNISNFFSSLLSLCASVSCPETPTSMFVKFYKREIEMPFASKWFDGIHDPRPKADWYYFPYLALFVDGERALVSTVGDNQEVTNWFQSATARIEGITGFRPLIIGSPNQVTVEGYTSDLLEVPPKIAGVGLASVKNQIEFPLPTIPLFEVMQHFEKQLIQLA